MKRFFYRALAIFSFLLITTLCTQGQQILLPEDNRTWQEMMMDPTTNFFATQQKFKDYWENRPVTKGSGFKAFKRWEWLMEPRVNEQGQLPEPDAVYQAMQQQPEMFETNSEMPGDWYYIGNTSVPSGGGGAGRINGIRELPGSTSTFFACSPGGGLWKTTNSGTSWSMVGTDFLSSIGVSDVAIDPTNTNVMYIATGDCDAGDTYALGVLKSIDGGLTWATTGLSWTVSQSRSTARILIDPTNTQIVICATSNGIYRTTNGGANWTQVQSGSFKDLSMKPGDATTWYACTDQFYRSTNGGLTWINITSGLPTAADSQRMSVAVSGNNSAFVYVLASGNGSGLQGVYLSTDGGSTFTQQADSSPNYLNWSTSATDIAGGQGWYDLRITADPSDANVIYIGGVNVWKSADAGITWTLVGHWYGGGGAPYVHADIHALHFVAGTSRLLVGCDGGVFTTTDGGLNFSDISSNLPIAQIYRLSVAGTNSNLVISGWQDNGTNLKNSGTHTRPMGGDGMDCQINPSNANIMYGELYYGAISKSTNMGATFSNIVGSGGLNEDEDGAWVTPFVLGPNPNHIFVGKSRVYKSTDAGTTFTSSAAFGGTGDCNDIAVAPSDANIVYASKGDSLFKSTDNAATFSAVSGTQGSFITDIAIHNTDPNKVWVTYSNYTAGAKIYFSSNGGATWTNISGSLPNLPANAVAFQPGSNNGIYVGMDAGVYYRDDVLGNFVPYMNALPNVVITDLDVHTGTSTITASTFGRGIWRAPVYALPNLDAVLNAVIQPNGTYCTTTVTPVLEILNAGTNPIISLVIQYQVDANPVQTFNWAGNITTGNQLPIVLPNINYGVGNFNFTATLVAINTIMDDNTANNSASSSYYCINGTNSAMLVLETDCWANETSWTITDAGANVVISGSGYSNETTYNIPICLDDGCYQFNIQDSYGDGISGSGCSGGAGNYYIYDVATSNSLVVMGTASFGTGISHSFCYPVGIIPGCMDNTACNYNALATTSDGSCTYGPVNDLCSGASTLTVNATETLSSNVNTCAHGTNPSCGGSQQIRDTWFKFVYTGGPVTITTNFTGGTLTDTRLAVFSSCGGTQIACNDDIGSGNYKSNIIIACGVLTLGQTYYIQAGGYNSTTGTFYIRVTAPVEICDLVDNDCDGVIDEGFDFDGDGFTSCNGDCNDTNNAIYPGASETCNAIDDDCDGSFDEGLLITYFRDQDNDSYGNISITTLACTQPAGYVTNSLDCNDLNAAIKPGATEVCNTIDDDCDGSVDEGVQTTFYRDFDGDGFGDVGITTSACSPPVGYVANATDCNDALVSVFPGAAEICNGIDDDCDSNIDEGVQTIYYRDLDNDGFGNAAVTILACSAPPGYVSNSTDCNDNDPLIFPGASENCNGIDDDCDTNIDEGVLNTFYRDQDNDGFGNLNVTALACSAPAGYVANATDCNDSNNAIHPGASEVCNTTDDDCDTFIDEGVTTTFFRDQDNDGFGNVSITIQACSVPAGYSVNSTDCNDNNVLIYPGATESCNSLDDDCDGQMDEGLLNTYYRDLDTDGYGNALVTTQACFAPAGYVSNSSDCNDNSIFVNPSAVEACNNVDDDCDVSIDEGFDNDNDGYKTCEGDCNDNNANIYPGAPEACNGLDDNCDLAIDNGVTFQNYYADLDNDGYGSALLGNFCTAPANSSLNNLDCNDSNTAINPNETELCNNVDDNCNAAVDEGFDQDNDTFTVCEGDCNDGNALIYPGASEICNGIDDDCDLLIDDGVLLTFYRDIDGDGFGQAAITTLACSPPAGYVANNTDCNDAASAIHPGAVEVCNGSDDDCDSLTDEGFDNDSDGVTTCDGDCDDNNVNVFPGSAEICNNIDDDCDGLQDEGFDSDNDGFTTCAGDCNDNNANIFPGAPEACNGIDDNCDLSIDNGVTFQNYYSDGDNDGYGSVLIGNFCSPPANSSLNNSDCNDGNPAINPNAIEICDGFDQDCDAVVDNGFDTDGDGFTTCSGDCDDNDLSVYPGASEVCNNYDDDCDGLTDEGIALLNWYIDADNDNYGSFALPPVQNCSQPAGYVSNNLDCNDGLSYVHPNATELCGNGIDEDCDGAVDEGCTTGTAPNDNMLSATVIPTTGNYYPFCNALVSSCLGSTISPESNPFNVVTGEDVWFRFTAPSPGISIELSTGTFDAVLELHDALGTEIANENLTSFGQQEILNLTGLTEGSQYYIVVRNYDSSLGNGDFTICVQALRDSWCGYGSGTFPICNNYKAIWTYANAYTFVFTNTLTNVSTSITGNGITALSNPSLGLFPGQSYTVYVNTVYNLVNGTGDLEQIVVEGNQLCNLTIGPQTDVQVKSSQRCPNQLSPNVFLQGSPTVCGAVYYNYEFTPTDQFGTPTGSAFVINTASAQPYQILAFTTPQALTPGGYYMVRIRPVFSSGPGNYGTPQCIRMQGGAPILTEIEDDANADEVFIANSETIISFFPNPSDGRLLNLYVQDSKASSVGIRLFNQMGQLVYAHSEIFNMELNTPLNFQKTLTSGLYIVEFILDDRVYTRRMIVEH